MATTKTKTKQKARSHREQHEVFVDTIWHFAQLCYDGTAEEICQQWAKDTNLCYQTICNVVEMNCHYHHSTTLFRMAEAVGAEILCQG